MSGKKEPGKIRTWLGFFNTMFLTDPSRSLVFSFLKFIFEALNTKEIWFDDSVTFYHYYHVSNSTTIKAVNSIIQREFKALYLASKNLADMYPGRADNLKTAIIVVAGYLYDQYHSEAPETEEFHDFLEGAKPQDVSDDEDKSEFEIYHFPSNFEGISFYVICRFDPFDKLRVCGPTPPNGRC